MNGLYRFFLTITAGVYLLLLPMASGKTAKQLSEEAVRKEKELNPDDFEKACLEIISVYADEFNKYFSDIMKAQPTKAILLEKPAARYRAGLALLASAIGKGFTSKAAAAPLKKLMNALLETWKKVGAQVGDYLPSFARAYPKVIPEIEDYVFALGEQNMPMLKKAEHDIKTIPKATLDGGVKPNDTYYDGPSGGIFSKPSK